MSDSEPIDVQDLSERLTSHEEALAALKDVPTILKELSEKVAVSAPTPQRYFENLSEVDDLSENAFDQNDEEGALFGMQVLILT